MHSKIKIILLYGSGDVFDKIIQIVDEDPRN